MVSETFLFIATISYPDTEIAVALQRRHIGENWEWLEKNLLPNLTQFGTGDTEAIEQYVLTKIESLHNVNAIYTPVQESSSSSTPTSVVDSGTFGERVFEGEDLVIEDLQTKKALPIAMSLIASVASLVLGLMKSL